MSSANVRSIQTLTDLKTGLARFGAESAAALQRMELELRRTLEWLDERRRHWEGQVRRCEEVARQAQAAVMEWQPSGMWSRRLGSPGQRTPSTRPVYAGRTQHAADNCATFRRCGWFGYNTVTVLSAKQPTRGAGVV